MNPFLIAGYEKPELFCNRRIETERLLNAIENSRNVTLISERRLGKTSLLNHVNYLQEKEVVFIYIDLYPTLLLKDFVHLLSANILEKLEPFSDKVMRKISGFFSAFKPTFSFDPETGTPSFELTISSISEAEKSVSLLLEYIRKSGKKVVLAFDEFQQITKYPEKNIEALLRSEIQKDNRTCFIFSGSQTHLLIAMFGAYSRPFYNSTEIMNLEKINQEEYSNFIIQNFTKGGFSIEKETANYICNKNNGITYNVQYHCHKLFSRGEKEISIARVDEMFKAIIKENEVVYYNYRELLSSLQYQLVKAIAKETRVEKPYSHKFITKYNLGSSSSIRTVIKNLSKKGILIQQNGVYLSDWYFSLWLKTQM